jgi:hypothetical protein
LAARTAAATALLSSDFLARLTGAFFAFFAGLAGAASPEGDSTLLAAAFFAGFLAAFFAGFFAFFAGFFTPDALDVPASPESDATDGASPASSSAI